MATPTNGSAPAPAGASDKMSEALNDIRAAAQKLHAAISDAASKRSGDMKADLAAIPAKAKAVSDSIKSTMTTQNETVKKQLTDAAANLQATQNALTDSMKASGQAFQTSVRQALNDARAAVQKISEAVATQRSAHPAAAAAIEAGMGAALVGRAVSSRRAAASQNTSK